MDFEKDFLLTTLSTTRRHVGGEEVKLHIQGVTGGMCETSGECSLCQTIPI